MEASARGAAEEKTRSGLTAIRIIGVTCKVFGERHPNPWIEENLIADSLFERLGRLLSMGRAYVVLPGGTGTLLELALVWEQINKCMIDRRPIVLLGSFWEGLLETMKSAMEQEGRPDPMLSSFVASTPKECVQHLATQLHGELP